MNLKVSCTLLSILLFAAVAATVLTAAPSANAQSGRIDLTLGLNFESNAGEQVRALEVQNDGKLIVAGNFRIANETRRDIIRLNTDNTLDTSFHAGTALAGNGGAIFAAKEQPDGKILIGGSFNNFNGNFVPGLIRLNSDGSIDPTFNVSGLSVASVFDIDLQSSGKVLASLMNNAGTVSVARFGTTGARDESFAFPFSLGSNFRVDVGAGDKIILGGNFGYVVNQTQYHNLARLGVDGALDSTFASTVEAIPFPHVDVPVDVMEINNGRVLVWGRIDYVNGLIRQDLAIVNADGSTNVQFNPSVLEVERVHAAEFQPDGKVLIAGENFSRYNTRVRGNVARLNADGSVDDSFFQGRGANGAVTLLKARGASGLVIAGDFFRYDRATRKYLAQVRL